MARVARIFMALAALLAASSATATATAPIPPSKDPWYTAPAGFQNAAPGAVLRLRIAPGNLAGQVVNCSAAYNILYRTTDSNYRPTWSVTTIFLPKAGHGNGNALLSYQIAYDTNHLDSSPSFILYQGTGSDITTALGLGWVVNVPDYEGPLASDTAGVMSGHSTIDSVRAALKSHLGVSPGARCAMWGYSGGALASEWAAELPVQYAPELSFAGAALGGLTPNVTNVLLSVDGTIEAGLIPGALLGLSSQYPAVRAFLVSKLKTSGPYNKTGFLAAENLNLTQSKELYGFQVIPDYFVDGIADILAPLVEAAINRDGIMGYHGVPQMPIFAYKAIQDEVSPIADTDALVAKYCGIGATIAYQRNTVGGHGAEDTNGDASAFAFLEAVLAGTYTATGCTTQNVTIAIDTSP